MLDNRKERLLRLIIEEYIERAEPVASRYLADVLELSSATIRNEMAALEDMGLLTQPHTSAGRIPSSAGYRLYVDALMQGQLMSHEERRQIDIALQEKVERLDRLLSEAGRLVADITRHASYTMTPTEGNYEREDVSVEGTAHMLEHPEFDDLSRVRRMINYLSDKQALANHAMRWSVERTNRPPSNVQILIGPENVTAALQDASVVMATYRYGESHGFIGLIGPTRMDYGAVTGKLGYIARKLEQLLQQEEDDV